ncbi:MAG: hypothetical protein AB1499_04175 [Nitrospirota bacterium]
MYSLSTSYKISFKAFLLFAILYNGYRYFFPWNNGGQSPSMPLYFHILKDMPWAIIVFFGLYKLYGNRIHPVELLYKGWKHYGRWTTFFITAHLILLAVAVLHLFHKNPIDVLQRDIKNVQYIFLPFIIPLIIRDENDAEKLISWIAKIGVSVSVFGYYTYLFIPSFTWDNAVLSTFQSPICFGTFSVVLFLISLSRIVLSRADSLFWHLAMCIFYGSILITASVAAVISMIVGSVLLLLISRPRVDILKKAGAFIVVTSLIFYAFGFFNVLAAKVNNSVSAYPSRNINNTYEIIDKKSSGIPSLSWDVLKYPYHPSPDNAYQFKIQYTSISARKAYFEEIVSYLKTASFKNILLGDFSLKNHFEYDNVYFYFIKNDGIIVTVLIFSLLMSGIFIGYNKFRRFRKTDNNNMASLSLGITASLFILTFIQFNLSYFFTIYPLNFLTYFLLILVCFMNPPDTGDVRS